MNYFEHSIPNFILLIISSMAFGRSFRKYGGYRRGKFSSSRRGSRYGRKGSWMNRNNSAAKQMAGFQNTQITLVKGQEITFGAAAGTLSSGTVKLVVGSQLVVAPMHIAMSNVYDQFRVRKVVLKITPTTAPSGIVDSTANYYNLFTVLDKSGFASAASLDQLQTYQSYKQTAYSSVPSNKAPAHYVTYYNSSLFEKSRWYDTKKTPVESQIAVGVFGGEALQTKVTSFQLEWTFDITYRGLRSDTSGIDGQVYSSPQ